MGRLLGADRPLPGSERLGSCLVRLPLFYNLSDDDQGRVIDRTREFLHGL
jgi:dTDP-4-amino-4,6-dideoxygalactose transaminase